MNLSTEPARLMALVHALLTAAAATGVLVADAPLVQFAIAGTLILGDFAAGKVVRNRVSPAYSDGHPVTNLPPDGLLQEPPRHPQVLIDPLPSLPPSAAGPVEDVQPPHREV